MFAPLFGQRRLAVRAVRVIQQAEGAGVDLAVSETCCDCEPIVRESGREGRMFDARQQTFDRKLSRGTVTFSGCADNSHRPAGVTHGREPVAIAFWLRLAGEATTGKERPRSLWDAQ